jgi:hypothetical protein
MFYLLGHVPNAKIMEFVLAYLPPSTPDFDLFLCTRYFDYHRYIHGTPQWSLYFQRFTIERDFVTNVTGNLQFAMYYCPRHHRYNRGKFQPCCDYKLLIQHSEQELRQIFYTNNMNELIVNTSPCFEVSSSSEDDI